MRTRKIVAIRISDILLRSVPSGDLIRISDIPYQIGFEPFNPSHANIMGIQYNLLEGEICLGLTHPEFREVPDYELIQPIRLEEARKRYPYLFVDTNPLLWRNFRREERPS